MNQQILLNHIHHPQQLDSASLNELEQFAVQYPYCQTVHLLIAKNYHNLKHQAYSQKLKIASAYSPDRKKLFQLINNISIAPPIAETKISETLAPLQVPEAVAFDNDESEVSVKNKTLADIGFPAQQNKTGLSPAEILAQRLAEIAAKNNTSSITLPVFTTEESSKTVENIEIPVAEPQITAKPEIEAINSTVDLPVFNYTLDEVIEEQPVLVKPVSGKRSFSEWLKLSNQGHQLHNNAAPKNKQAAIIDAFIQSEPRIMPGKAANYPTVNLAWESEEDDEIVSETLAKIFTQQGNFSKALIMYEKLSLKFPEKSAYFAPLIENLKTQIS